MGRTQRTQSSPPGPEDQGATEEQRSGGGPRGTVDLTVPHAADVSSELGSLAALMTQPGTLVEPREDG